ncbi:MAG: methylated-DNA--protein-cysteine methyltransferase [Gammaproteobacteria bacterium HGW-Gammaproteobacteria-2]|jgi:methylated-DNA-protein-cysteine methyltransferase-like protein|nr:MAG: methylated-DNA--protein-cysteine methyltransferase [Gammaproteobacteria bacterium HGW-Gammaproteobacteria-2]
MTNRSANEIAIVAALRQLRRGEVVAYGEVARRAGLPGRARLVARVLAHSPVADLPWHRVLRADGRIAFAPGSEGYIEQLRRLQTENVTVVDGRVRMASVAGKLDALLWASPPADE